MSSGYGHGSSFPELSSCTGRPWIAEESTVETVLNAFCANDVETPRASEASNSSIRLIGMRCPLLLALGGYREIDDPRMLRLRPS
jgi:hypothetical protein